MDIASENIEQTITGAHFRRGEQWFGVVRLHLQIMKHDLFEWADRGLRDRHISIEGFADARENDALEKGRARPNKVRRNE